MTITLIYISNISIKIYLILIGFGERIEALDLLGREVLSFKIAKDGIVGLLC